MSSVYGGSSLNIAAASAKDGSIGCFFDRNVKAVQRVRISAVVQGQERIYDCAGSGVYRRCVSQTPLARGSWVLRGGGCLEPSNIRFYNA
jgi:hypothetical protein